MTELRKPVYEEFFNSISLCPAPLERGPGDELPLISEELSAKLRSITENWLNQLYALNYTEVWQGMSTSVKEQGNEKRFRSELEKWAKDNDIDRSITVARKFLNMRRSFTIPGNECPVLYFEAIAPQNRRLLEIIVLRRDEDVRWRVLTFFHQEKEGQSLDQELARLDANSALIIASQEVDNYPLWSVKGDYLAALIANN